MSQREPCLATVKATVGADVACSHRRWWCVAWPGWRRQAALRLGTSRGKEQLRRASRKERGRKKMAAVWRKLEGAAAAGPFIGGAARA
jgi:glutathione S-transferase